MLKRILLVILAVLAVAAALPVGDHAASATVTALRLTTKGASESGTGFAIAFGKRALEGVDVCLGTDIRNVIFEGCTRAPCQLTVGQMYNVKVDFVALRSHRSLKATISFDNYFNLEPALDVEVPNSAVEAGQLYTLSFNLQPRGQVTGDAVLRVIVYNDEQSTARGIIIHHEDGGGGGDLAKLEYGDKSFIHVRVRNPSTFIRLINEGSVGFAGTYMERWWDCETEQLEELTVRAAEMLHAWPQHPVLKMMDWITLNCDERPWETRYCYAPFGVSYDADGWVSEMGAEFFGAMLGQEKLYMCGSWKTGVGAPKTLEEAQTASMKLLGQKLALEPGMRLLDLGCGYGALTRFLAERYNLKAVGCTNSAEEATHAIGSNVKAKECDYKVLTGKFDRVVCIQMLEHLGGPRNYAAFFEKVDSLLTPDGLFVLQTPVIGSQGRLRRDTFVRQYIIRNFAVPHTLDILTAAESQFLVEDLQNISTDWERTVRAYEANLGQAWKEGLSEKYDAKYYRLFKLYLKMYIGAIMALRVQMWQVVFSKKNSGRGYE